MEAFPFKRGPAHLTKTKKKQKAYLFDGSCVDDDCVLDMPSFMITPEQTRVEISMEPTFRTWTSQELQPDRTAADRRARGCIEKVTEKGNKVFTGKRCRVKRKSGKCKPEEEVADAFCKAKLEPCPPKAPCPIALTFKKGRPYLRLCIEPYSPGHLIPVPGRREMWPENAQKLAKRACASWPQDLKLSRKQSKAKLRKWAKENWPEDFFANEVPDLVEQREGLGRSPKPAPKWLQGESGAWIMLMAPIGVLFGLILARRQRAQAQEPVEGVTSADLHRSLGWGDRHPWAPHVPGANIR